MARISLREYIHEIESLIDRGDTQKAIAHCKHILRYFPKHIDTYRLFGKALLEVQKYGDASDIFQRVLSSVPDDFISQIGMSIIREDENNLDAAIWHLERAFEIQPSNKAVQDELKRLYASRDGVTPTKIRLTRGALVRMYARGELYPQAIAEIKAALLEDQSRVDLEVILARLYFLLEQKIESTETCSSLISKLPYCYEANRILAALLPGTKRAEDAKIFEQRVIDLDPYFAFVSENTPNPIDIPDNKVMMEYLDWEPGMEESEKEQPDWAKSIGINWETENKSESAQIDTWLNSESKLQPEENVTEKITLSREEKHVEIPQTQSEDQTLQIEKTAIPTDSSFIENLNNDQDFPKWMMDAGWQPSKEIDETAQKGFNLDMPEEPVKIEESEEIVQGTIPEWIQKLAPKDTMNNEDEEEKETGIPIQDDNFESIFSFEKHDAIATDKLEFEQATASDWISEIATNQISEVNENIEEPVIEQQRSDEFINISFDENEFPDETKPELAEDELISKTDDIPQEIETEKYQLEEEIDLPQGILTDSIIQEPEIELPNEDETDDLFITMPEEEVNVNQTLSHINIPQEEPVNDMSWLHDLIHEEENPQIITTDELLTSDVTTDSADLQIESSGFEGESEKDFTWLNALQADVEDSDLLPESEPETFDLMSETTITTEDELSPSINELEMEKLVTDESQVPENELEKEDRFVEIDESISEEAFTPVEIPTNTFLSEIVESLPEESLLLETKKLDESIAFIDETPIVQDEMPVSEIGIEELTGDVSFDDRDITKISLEEKTPDWVESLIKEIPDIPEEKIISEDEEGAEIGAALAWMESLAAKHGAEENTLYTKPEDREKEPPDWIKAFQDDAERDNDQEKVSETSLPDDILSDLDMTPSWLQELHLETSGHDEVPDEMIKGLKEFFDPSDEKEIFLEDESEISESLSVELQISEEVVEKAESVEELAEPEIILESEMMETETYINESEEKLSASQELESFTDLQESMKPEEFISEPIEVETNAIPELSVDLAEAKLALSKGNIEDAVSIFSEHIKSKSSLDEIISELKNSLDHYYPIDISLWQTLGDAYFKKNQLKNALAAYSKAEELLT